MSTPRTRSVLTVVTAVLCLLLATSQPATADQLGFTNLCPGCTVQPSKISMNPDPAIAGKPVVFTLEAQSSTALSSVTAQLDYYYLFFGVWVHGFSDTEQVSSIPAGSSITPLAQDMPGVAPSGDYYVTITLTTAGPTVQGSLRAYFSIV